MASLYDQSFNKEAWLKLGLVAVAAGVAALLVYGSVEAHRRFVSVPHLLAERHQEPVGTPGRITTQITGLGAEAVDTLALDVRDHGQIAGHRRKSVELLSGIEDPRVLPLLGEALGDPDLGVRLAAVAGIARSGKAEGAALLWKAIETAEDWPRHRMIVALGLVAAGADIDALLKRTEATRGQDRLLFAWAAGQAQRRKTDVDQVGRVPPAAPPEDDVQELKMQDDVDMLIAKINKGTDLAASCLELARATAVEFGTWNFAHQISYQTIAVYGPMALRGTAKMEAVPMPLQLKDRPVADEGGAALAPAAVPAPASAP